MPSGHSAPRVLPSAAEPIAAAPKKTAVKAKPKANTGEKVKGAKPVGVEKKKASVKKAAEKSVEKGVEKVQ